LGILANVLQQYSTLVSLYLVSYTISDEISLNQLKKTAYVIYDRFMS